MADNVVNPDDVPVVPVEVNLDVDNVVKTLETVLKVAKSVSGFTPNEVDDKVVALLADLVSEEWFKEVLELVLGMVADGKSEAEIRAAVSAVAGR